MIETSRLPHALQAHIKHHKKPSIPEVTQSVKSPTVTVTDTKCAMPTKQSKDI